MAQQEYLSFVNEAIYALKNFGFDINEDDAKLLLIPGFIKKENDGSRITDKELNLDRKSLQDHETGKTHLSKEDFAVARTVSLLKSAKGREIFRHALKKLSKNELLELFGTNDDIDEAESN